MTEATLTYDQAHGSVEFLYRVLLGRKADKAGLDHCVAALTSGQMDEPTLALAMIGSGEFRQNRGTPIAYAGYETVQVLECTFLTPEGSGLAAEFSGPGGYEPWVLPYFLDLCRPGMTVLDIGASVGAFALPAAKRVAPGGCVYAVEVSLQNCRLLAQSIALNTLDNVKLLPLGLSDHLGFGRLPRQRTTNNNALEADGKILASDIQSHDVVPVLPLDLLRPAMRKIDLVKMDIEGMEYRATLGALDMLRADRPIVFMEYSPRFQERLSKVAGAELLKLFVEQGYRFEILHRNAPREMVTPGDVIERIDQAWAAHVRDDGGSHLDLCLHPLAS
jgi:FkbM family methyltransferase